MYYLRELWVLLTIVQVIYSVLSFSLEHCCIVGGGVIINGNKYKVYKVKIYKLLII